MINRENDIKRVKLLAALPISAEQKIHKLTDTVLTQLMEDESFAGMIALNTQMLLERTILK